jgi:hypothetical protein
MLGPNGEGCGNCYYWVKYDPNRPEYAGHSDWKDIDISGFCLRYPKGDSSVKLDYGWCGEYKNVSGK